MAARGWDWRVVEMGEGGQKVQTFSYKIINCRDVMYSIITIVYYIEYLKVKIVDIKSSIKKIVTV